MSSLHIIFASTSGHTEYVVDTLIESMKDSGIAIEKQRVELAKPEDMLRGDVLILGSGTWNTGSVEGQLNPYMHFFLRDKAKDFDLKGKKVGIIGLGDERYFFTAAAKIHLEEYVKTHGGELLEPGLRIVNEPYGQEEVVRAWAKEFIKNLPTTH